MSAATDRSQANRSLVRGNQEWIAAGIVILLAVAIGYWLVNSSWFDSDKASMDIGTKQPIENLSGAQCKPLCRSTFKRCDISSQGFGYQHTRCQESLKSCLMGCDR